MIESEVFNSNMFQNTTTIVDDNTEDDNPCEDEVSNTCYIKTLQAIILYRRNRSEISYISQFQLVF